MSDTLELNHLREWAEKTKLGNVTPSVKVNGLDHPTALIVVDVGQPIEQVRLTNEQLVVLADHLRKAAKEMLGKDVPLRVSADNNYGIHWVSAS